MVLVWGLAVNIRTYVYWILPSAELALPCSFASFSLGPASEVIYKTSIRTEISHSYPNFAIRNFDKCSHG